MSKIPFILVVLSSTLAACADKGATDTEDTVADSGDSVDSVDSETSDTVTADIAAVDGLQPLYIKDVPVTFDGETTITDENGYVRLQLPKNSALTIHATAPGYMNGTLLLFTLDETIKTYIQLITTAARDAVSAQLGIPYDPTKGIVGIQVYTRDEAGGAVRLAGATVDLDVAYSVALASDNRSPAGFVPSNVTVTESESTAQINFINVTAGTVNVTVTPPAPHTTCTWYRGDTRLEDYALEVAADTLTTAFVFCE